MCALAMTATAVSLTMVSLRSEGLHKTRAATGIDLPRVGRHRLSGPGSRAGAAVDSVVETTFPQVGSRPAAGRVGCQSAQLTQRVASGTASSLA